MARITNSPTVNVTRPTSVTTEADTSTAPSSSGLDLATEGGQVPSGEQPTTTTGTSGVNAVGLRGPASLRKDLFDLNHANAPGAVSLTDVLKQAGPPAVKYLIANLQQQTGITLDPTVVAAATAKPENLVALLQFTPQQMVQGIDALNAAHKAGKIDDVPTRKRFLGDKIDLGNLDLSKVKRPGGEVKELAPGLFKGTPISDLPDDQAKMRIALAETFDQLAENALRPASDRVEVKFAGRKFTRLDTFLDELKNLGFKVSVHYRRRIANFAELMTKHPATGQLLDVPAPLMVRTGVKDAQGKEAVVPAVHSEAIIDLEPPADAEARGLPKLEGTLKWYQGVSATGFFAEGLHRTPPWTGKETMQNVPADKAIEAVELAGLQSAMINQVADQHDLLAAGYGVIGVCNDSVAWNQQVVMGSTDVYPLLHRDALLEPILDKLLSDADRRDDPELRALKKAIKALPSDQVANDSSASRAGASVPWPKGKEPLVAATHAQATLP